MSTVFADTFYWIAFTLPREAAYAQAQSITDNIVTTEEVLGEYLTFFSRAPAHLRRRAGMTVKTILTDSKVRVIPQSHESFMLGLDLYLARADKGYSLIDCISMQTMEREGLKEVPHQRQAFRTGRLPGAVSRVVSRWFRLASSSRWARLWPSRCRLSHRPCGRRFLARSVSQRRAKKKELIAEDAIRYQF